MNNVLNSTAANPVVPSIGIPTEECRANHAFANRSSKIPTSLWDTPSTSERDDMTKQDVIAHLATTTAKRSRTSPLAKRNTVRIKTRFAAQTNPRFRVFFFPPLFPYFLSLQDEDPAIPPDLLPRDPEIAPLVFLWVVCRSDF